jgi:2-oxoglutarate ferredoxin oxidoreductase subunit alpha
MYDEVIGHMRERFVPPDPAELKLVTRKRTTAKDPKKYLPYEHTKDDVPPWADFGDNYRYHVTGLFHDETGFPTNDPAEIHQKQQRLVRKLERCRSEVEAFEERDLEGADYAIVAYGSTARSAAQAAAMLREDGLRVGTFRLKTAWPFPDKRLRQVAKGRKGLVVAEMNLGQMVYEVERAANGQAPVTFFGKMDGELLTPDEIRDAVQEVMA